MRRRASPRARGSAPGRKRGLLDLFRGWHAPIEALIEATDESVILRNDVYDRPPLPHWSVGRATLLGDSAHPMTPDMGQGACQAIEDAVILAIASATPPTSPRPSASTSPGTSRAPVEWSTSRARRPDRPVVEPARLPIPRGPAQVALRGPQAGRATGLDDLSAGLTGPTDQVVSPADVSHQVGRLSPALLMTIASGEGNESTQSGSARVPAAGGPRPGGDGLAVLGGVLGAATGRPKVAAIVTEFTYRSHAHVILENFLDPYLFNGERTDPGVEVVSLYVDQFPEDDMARDVARQYGIPIYPTIGEALRIGGKTLGVDGVLSIGEHGKYPVNAKGQVEYPRKRFFDEIVAVFRGERPRGAGLQRQAPVLPLGLGQGDV